MLCSKPYKQGIEEYGCGQCLPCRINRRRIWVTRLMLEARQHQSSLFVTLTYSDEHLPVGGNLVKKELQDFLKRVRKRLEPDRIRYFAVGEYGSLRLRPHFHLIMFGVGVPNHVPATKKCPEAWKICPCVLCASWRKGGISVRGVGDESCAYVCGYLLKHGTKSHNERVGDLAPEFATMSLRPGGIGYKAVQAVKEAVTDRDGVIVSGGAVPIVMRFTEGGKKPIGRYLRKKLEAVIGSTELLEAEKHVRLLEHQRFLREGNGRTEHEDRRLQDARRARVRESIIRSKKGIRL